VRKFPDQIESAQWGKVVTTGGAVLDLHALFDPEEVGRLYRHLDAARDLAEGIRSWPIPHRTQTATQRGEA
jgi:hypothetical protein